MPLARYQVIQSLMYVLIYYYAPCTRALQQFFMCRSLAGSKGTGDFFKATFGNIVRSLCIFRRPRHAHTA